MNFKELNLSDALIDALSKENISTPTEIQSSSMETLSLGKDSYICSETGSGKTLAYLLPILMKIDLESIDLQCVIMVPTHELAAQIQEQIILIAKNADWKLRSQLLIGQTNIKRQKEKLKLKPHIVVGTPGRLFELTSIKKLKVHKLTHFVMDEVDKLLLSKNIETTMNFVRATPKSRQMIYASATMPDEVKEVIFQISSDVEWIETIKNEVNKNISHYYIEASDYEKTDILRKFIQRLDLKKVIVFVHQNKSAENISAVLDKHGIAISEIHGMCGKLDRKKALTLFKNGKTNVLVSSDVSARGLHISDVSHIINYDIPSKSVSYIHRAGRSGRIDQKGNCLSLVGRHDLNLISDFEEELGINIQKATLGKDALYT